MNACYLGAFRAVCRTWFGRKVVVDTRDFSVAPHLLLDGEWEMWESQALLQLVRPGDIVVEVGANFGYYTLLFAHLGAAQVLAYEPNPRVAGLLRLSVTLNGFNDRVRVVEAAVGDTNRPASLSLPPHLWGGASVCGGAAKTFPVQMVSLDTELAAWTRLDVLKADVEGAEFLLLAGARHTIERLRPRCLILEFWPARFAGQGLNPSEAADWLESLGYRPHVVALDHSGRLLPITKSYLLQINDVDCVWLL